MLRYAENWKCVRYHNLDSGHYYPQLTLQGDCCAQDPVENEWVKGIVCCFRLSS